MIICCARGLVASKLNKLLENRSPTLECELGCCLGRVKEVSRGGPVACDSAVYVAERSEI